MSQYYKQLSNQQFRAILENCCNKKWETHENYTLVSFQFGSYMYQDESMHQIIPSLTIGFRIGKTDNNIYFKTINLDLVEEFL